MPDGSSPASFPADPPREPARLAPLRSDIEVHAGARNADGSPSWVLHDPAAGSYINLGDREMHVIERWALGSADAIVEALSAETTFRATRAEIDAIAGFLARQGLLLEGGRELYARHQAITKPQDVLSRAVTGLLFPKLPLMAPQRLLDRLVPWTHALFSPLLWLAALAVLVAAGLLIQRELPRFVASFATLQSFEGGLAVLVVIAVAKSMHELAHGVAARRYGADVPTLGVSLVLFCPLLYVETSPAWLVASRGQRLQIAVAGMALEALLAIGALIAWPFMEAGPLRDAAGFCGTTLLLISLAINANPLMRFDGYYMLSDALGIDNLQPRSLALVRWVARRHFAGLADPSPEPALGASMRRAMLIYGAACLAWRVVLYAGIAAALMLLLPPVAALPLAVAVLGLYLVRPALKGLIMTALTVVRRCSIGGVLRMGLTAAALLAAVFVPWRSTIAVPVVVEGAEAHDIFAPEAAAVCGVVAGDGTEVRAGDTIAELCSPDLQFALERARVKASGLSRALDRQATGVEFHAGLPVRAEELARLDAEIAGYRARLANLRLVAPAGGRLRILDRGLIPGRWVRADQPLAQIERGGAAKAHAYIEERDLAHVAAGARVSFWLDGTPLEVHGAEVASVNAETLAVLDEPSLAVPSGGPIAVRAATNGALVPELAHYKAPLRLVSQARLSSARLRGMARIDTPPRNLFERFRQRIVGFWRRELG